MRPFAPAVRRLVVLAAAVGMLLTGGITPSAIADPPESRPGKPTTLRILSFNIWFGGTAVPNGLDHVAETVRMHDANVILLSESGSATDELAEILSTPGKPYYAAASGDAGIVSAFPIISQADLPWTKKAVLDVNGREVAAYAAHLYFANYAEYLSRGYGGGVAEPSEFAQYGWDLIPSGPITDVDALLKVNEDSGRPAAVAGVIADAAKERAKGRAVFFGGDFNEASAFDWTEATADLFDHHGVVAPWQSTLLLDDAGFVDAYRATYPNPVTHPGFTWLSDNPDKELSEFVWTPEADDRDRIDYVFHAKAPGVKLLGAGVVGPRTSIVRNERVVEDIDDNFLPVPAHWPSDHKAVLATYRLAGSPARP